ncbi:MAG: transcriptional regulator, Fis family [Gammaproteobacteria bacterium]|jgi:Fis family transcriptional regulator|nr:transcriptional regulator, Fis family [Gammaproteobacteria bacterium]
MAKYGPRVNLDSSHSLTLRDHIGRMMHIYYQTTDSHMKIEGMYDLVMTEVEQPLLEATLVYTNGNLSQASSILGLSRNMLRKKLQRYGMYPQI